MTTAKTIKEPLIFILTQIISTTYIDIRLGN